MPVNNYLDAINIDLKKYIDTNIHYLKNRKKIIQLKIMCNNKIEYKYNMNILIKRGT